MPKSLDLRTGKTVWESYRKPRIHSETLGSDIQTDILVIGAGISGAMMAEALTGHGFDVVVVDKRKSLSGSTFASTALLQYEIDIPYIKLANKIGRTKATTAWRRSKIGLESLAAKIAELQIECAMQRRDSLYLSGNVLSAEQLKIEGELRTLIGLPTRYLTRKDLKNDYGVSGESALLSYNNMVCNPVQLAAGFLKESIHKGVKVYSGTEIISSTAAGRYVYCKTDNGSVIKARYVIFTTGYETNNSKTRKHKITSTWAIATKPLKAYKKPFPMIWEASDPYIYMRTTQDGRILFGGEDEEFSDEEKRDKLIEKKKAALEKKLLKLIPRINFETEYCWTGSFGASTNGLPSIGRIPGKNRCYAVMAYGGNGITFSRIAAELISADILGNKDPDADLFSFR